MKKKIKCCEHEFENANCTNCANGLPTSAYECAKTKGTLKQYCHEKAEALHRQKYNEGYEQGYEQGRADAEADAENRMQSILDDEKRLSYQQGRADAIEECIEMLEDDCFLSGTASKVLIHHLEQLKE